MNKRILRQAQELQSKLAKAQEELGKKTVEASVGGGAVTVVVNGHQRVQSVKISPDAVDPKDISLLEDLVLAAMNEALEKSQELMQQGLGNIASGFNIPGLGL